MISEFFIPIAINCVDSRLKNKSYSLRPERSIQSVLPKIGPILRSGFSGKRYCEFIGQEKVVKGLLMGNMSSSRESQTQAASKGDQHLLALKAASAPEKSTG